MLRAFVNAFKVPDLRRKILFTLLIIGVYRFGSWIPVPGADFERLRSAAGEGGGGIRDLINLFSGGALTQMAVFALGIMPYITASIIMQLLTVVIPRLERWQQEGEQGRRRITQWTRYVTVMLALLQSSGLTVLARNETLFGVNVLPQATGWTIALIILTLTAGTAFIMWLGELITQRGVGNGMSLLIYVSIIAVFPAQFGQVLSTNGAEAFSMVLLLGAFLTVAIVFMEQGQRRVPVQYARRQVGRRVYGGQSTYIPLKVNQAGVIPIIFASSLLYLPTLAASISTWQPLVEFNQRHLANPASFVYIATFAVLNIFFTYFYTAIAFNPIEVSDNIKRYGGFIPGIRPGRQTAEYLDRVLTRLTLPGSLYLTTVAVIPFVALALANVQAVPLGGISLLIVVGVALETMKQIESQLLQRHYEGFLA
ncbi:MAG TPA: preprotein translocase subunit SecY [Nitriliruptorales bacterium]|nr:preprotein translocase subunit SecY [Nitriliruptorales bacterium]